MAEQRYRRSVRRGVSPHLGRRVMGLDVSLTRTGIVVGERGHRVVRHRSIGSTSTYGELEERIDLNTKIILQIWKVYEPDFVVMESGARGGKVVDLSVYHLAGVVRYELWKRGALVVMAAPNTLKAHLGNGRYNKDQMLEAVRELWPDCPHHDEGDAWAAASWGLTHYDELLVQRA